MRAMLVVSLVAAVVIGSAAALVAEDKPNKPALADLAWLAGDWTTDGIWFRIRHFSRALEPWKMDAAGPMSMKLASSGASEVVFEDRKQDFPRREGDKLTARLEGEQNGKPAAEEFVFKLSAK